MNHHAAICALLIFTGCASAQAEPAPQPETLPATAPATASGDVDALLRALDVRGDTLGDFAANLHLVETDQIAQLSTERTGRIWFQSQGPGDARVRVLFDKRVTDRGRKPERIEYILDDGELLDRDYQKRIEVKRQVVRPGEQVDLLRLGEGPFPLPLGQNPDDVKRLFDVSLVGKSGTTAHVLLVPKPDTDLAGEFKQLEVWVDEASSMPTRITTTDPDERRTSTYDLLDIQLNTGLGDGDFRAEPLGDKDQWQFRFEAYER
jgi:hypothetical protein